MATVWPIFILWLTYTRWRFTSRESETQLTVMSGMLLRDTVQLLLSPHLQLAVGAIKSISGDGCAREEDSQLQILQPISLIRAWEAF